MTGIEKHWQEEDEKAAQELWKVQEKARADMLQEYGEIQARIAPELRRLEEMGYRLVKNPSTISPYQNLLSQAAMQPSIGAYGQAPPLSPLLGFSSLFH